MKKFLLPLIALLLATTAATAQKVNLLSQRKANGVVDVKKASVNKDLKIGFKNQKDSKANPSQWLTSKQLQAVQAPTTKRSKAITRAGESDNTTWWTYPTGDGNIYGMRNSSDYDYNLAILVPSSLAGVKVDSVLFAIYDATKVSNLKLWIDECQYDSDGNLLPPPLTAAECDYSYDVTNPVSVATGGPTIVKLPQEYTIPTNGCFVGYSFTTTANDSYPLVYYSSQSASIAVDGGFFYVLDGAWYDMYQYNYNANLTIALHIDMTGLIQNSVSPYGIMESTGKVGESVEITAMAYNNSPVAIDSISFVPSQNGVDGEEQTYIFDGMLNGNQYGYFNFDMVPEKEGVNKVGIKITKVNGVANTAEGTTTEDGVLVGLTETAERTSVVEEITGSWCGWCPRGHVGLANLKKKYGDKIVTLAAHFGDSESNPDAMATEDYYYVQYWVSGSVGTAPDAIFDRIVNGDPYSGMTGTDIDGVSRFHADAVVEVIKQYFPSEADLTLEAGWADENHTSLNTRVNTTFKYNRENYPYGLVFALTEDGMFGSGTGWTQENYYSAEYAEAYKEYYGQELDNTYTDSDMDEYSNGKFYITNQEYNNVIVGSWYNTEIEEGQLGALYGIDTPFLTASNVKNQTITWTPTLTFNDYTKSLIQDDTQLSLAVLLVNNNNGQVVNAAQVKIGDEIFQGISNVTTSDKATVASRYNANGQRMAAPAKGLNIVKMSNGEVKKVIVK